MHLKRVLIIFAAVMFVGLLILWIEYSKGVVAPVALVNFSENTREYSNVYYRYDKNHLDVNFDDWLEDNKWFETSVVTLKQKKGESTANDYSSPYFGKFNNTANVTFDLFDGEYRFVLIEYDMEEKHRCILFEFKDGLRLRKTDGAGGQVLVERSIRCTATGDASLDAISFVDFVSLKYSVLVGDRIWHSERIFLKKWESDDRIKEALIRHATEKERQYGARNIVESDVDIRELEIIGDDIHGYMEFIYQRKGYAKRNLTGTIKKIDESYNFDTESNRGLKFYFEVSWSQAQYR